MSRPDRKRKTSRRARRRRAALRHDPPRGEGVRVLWMALLAIAVPAAVLGWLAHGKDNPGARGRTEFCERLYAEARTAADTAAVDRTLSSVTRSGQRSYCVETRLSPRRRPAR